MLNKGDPKKVISVENINYSNVIEHLLSILPEFREIHQKMLDYSGEIFPYVLIGSGLVKFTTKNYEVFVKSAAEYSEAADILNRITNFLESCALSKDEEVIELIRIGFMEHLDLNSDNVEGFVSMLKPQSKRLLDEVKNI